MGKNRGGAREVWGQEEFGINIVEFLLSGKEISLLVCKAVAGRLTWVSLVMNACSSCLSRSVNLLRSILVASMPEPESMVLMYARGTLTDLNWLSLGGCNERFVRKEIYVDFVTSLRHNFGCMAF